MTSFQCCHHQVPYASVFRHTCFLFNSQGYPQISVKKGVSATPLTILIAKIKVNAHYFWQPYGISAHLPLQVVAFLNHSTNGFQLWKSFFICWHVLGRLYQRHSSASSRYRVTPASSATLAATARDIADQMKGANTGKPTSINNLLEIMIKEVLYHLTSLHPFMKKSFHHA